MFDEKRATAVYLWEMERKQKILEELEEKYKDSPLRCPNCGRGIAPNWKYCIFCNQVLVGMEGWDKSWKKIKDLRDV